MMSKIIYLSEINIRFNYKQKNNRSKGKKIECQGENDFFSDSEA